METVLGYNMKRFRRELSLSLNGLAEEMGVAASFLSQVETGKVSPSLARLKQIAAVLNVTTSDLIGETGEGRGEIVVGKDEARLIPVSTRGIRIELLSSKHMDHFMQPYKITFQAEADTEDFHTHFGQECGLVLEGRVDLWVGDKHFKLGPGDNFYYNSGLPHRIANSHDHVSVVYMVANPPIFL